MYAPKLLPYSAEERWQMGFEYRINRMADEALNEIRTMVAKAKTELGLWNIVSADTDAWFLQSGSGVTAAKLRSNMLDLEDKIERLSWGIYGARIV